MKQFLLPLSLFIATLPINSQAIDGVLASMGWGISDDLIQYESTSGATQLSLGSYWNTDINFSHGVLGYGEVHVEAYISHLSHQQNINLLALRPVISFWESHEKKRSWYWQAGLGLAYFNSKDFGQVQLSTNAQFATIFGLGMSLDKNARHSLTLRYNHYSNGYIKKPNRGLDTISLDWHFQL